MGDLFKDDRFPDLRKIVIRHTDSLYLTINSSSLRILDVSYNKFKKLKIKGNLITEIYCCSNQIENMVIACPNLKILIASINRLQSLEWLKSLTNLEFLALSNNNFNSFQLQHKTLKRLSICDSKIVTLNLDCPLLEELFGSANKLANIELNCPNLHFNTAMLR